MNRFEQLLVILYAESTILQCTLLNEPIVSGVSTGFADRQKTSDRFASKISGDDNVFLLTGLTGGDGLRCRDRKLQIRYRAYRWSSRSTVYLFGNTNELFGSGATGGAWSMIVRLQFVGHRLDGALQCIRSTLCFVFDGFHGA